MNDRTELLIRNAELEAQVGMLKGKLDSKGTDPELAEIMRQAAEARDSLRALTEEMKAKRDKCDALLKEVKAARRDMVRIMEKGGHKLPFLKKLKYWGVMA